MKKSLLKDVMVRLAGSVAVVFLAMGVLGGSEAVAGIASTKHNLGSGGQGVNTFSGTAEICVFCHTPHGADTSAAVPLWNRVLASPAIYTTYNSLGTSSLDGATAPVGSVSIACLSCHDGTQAMNVMINQPGSGGYNSSGAALTGTWSGANQTSGVINTVAMLGVDLRNDHPIGIQYAGGPSTGSMPAGTTGTVSVSSYARDKDFNDLYTNTLNNSQVWWVDTGNTGVREKTDMLLYSRTDSTSMSGVTTATTGGTLTGAQPFVECASCHDPHVSANVTFLRISNAGSAVCLACHIK